MVSSVHWRERDWLSDHFAGVLDFYYPDCIDTESGGHVAQLDEESGDVYDTDSKHLVATTRFIVNFSLGSHHSEFDWCEDMARHGLDFLQEHHYDDHHGGYHWLLEGADPVDSKRVCYGHAFALLALSRALEFDIEDTSDELESLYELIIDKFWEAKYDLCKSKYDSSWSNAELYRGQNANMHMCEALIAAYEATGEQRYLDRAVSIAQALTVELAEATDGLIWEHYTADWEHDLEYNRENPMDTFRPWGYQPGHQIEWAKLLGLLHRHTDADWLLPRAEELFDAAIEYGWDENDGGFYYSFDLDGEPVVSEKYSWEVAEAIGAAAVLAARTDDDRYVEWYDTFWSYANEALVNPKYGNWYTKVTEDNEPVPTTEGVAVEPGYHPIGACVEGLHMLSER